jgi:hypothetical protein
MNSKKRIKMKTKREDEERIISLILLRRVVKVYGSDESIWIE